MNNTIYAVRVMSLRQPFGKLRNRGTFLLYGRSIFARRAKIERPSNMMYLAAAGKTALGAPRIF
jgi:hypothetical protein